MAQQQQQQQQQQHGQYPPQHQHLRQQHHDRQRHSGSYPPPLFVAELEAMHTPGSVASPDGGVAFEMPAETTAPKQDDQLQDRRPRTEEVGPEAQANPWPFYLDQDHGQRTTNDEDGKSGDVVAAKVAAEAANPWPYHGPQMEDGDDAAPSATVYPQVARPISAAGTAPPASGASTHDSGQAEQLSPTRIADNGQYPLPLRISRPNSMVASSPPPVKPYSPPPGRDDISAGGVHNQKPAQSHIDNEHAPPPASLSFKPYRPPGSPQRDHTSPTATSPGAAPHHFYTPFTEDRLSSPTQQEENRVASPMHPGSPGASAVHGMSTSPGTQEQELPYPNSPERRGTSSRPVSQNGLPNNQSYPAGDVPMPNGPPAHNTVTSAHSASSTTSLPPRVQSPPTANVQHSPSLPSKSPVASPQAYPVPHSQGPSVASSPHSIQQHMPTQSPVQSPPPHGYQSPSVQSAHSDPTSPPAQPHHPPSPPPPPVSQSPPMHQMPNSPPPMYSPGPGGPPRPNSSSPQPTPHQYQYPQYSPPPAQPMYGGYPQGPPPRPGGGYPPPLPPRRPQVPYSGFGGGPSNAPSYPPPPKTQYKPGPPPYPPRPMSNAMASSSLFSSSSARKWLDKTSQVIENTLESVLQGPQGPPNRPAYVSGPPPPQQPPPWNGGGYQQHPGMPPQGGYNGPWPGPGAPRR